jgi:arylsulfatase A-like enzyme
MTNLVADAAIRFLERTRDQRFALWVSIPDPHTPYHAPEPYASRFPAGSVTLPPWKADELASKPERQRVLARITGVANRDPDDVRRLIGIYHAMIAQIDEAVGRILEALDRVGRREDTMVVFVSDHGDLMAEHAMVEKGGCLYDALTRVPLVLSWPGHLPEGRTQRELVNLVDVMPTLLGLAGLRVPARVQGWALPGTGLPGSDRPRGVVFSEYGAGGPRVTLADLDRHVFLPNERPIMALLRAREAEGRPKMVRTADWKLVHDPLGDLDELYDLRTDPWELENLIGRPEFRDVVHDLMGKLLDWSVATEDHEPVPLYY